MINHRRIVTAVTDDDRSVITDRGPSPNVITPAPGRTLAEQWMCTRIDTDLLTAPDGTTAGFVPVPPPGGVLFRLVSFPPDPHGQMHRTDTIDFVTVVSGQLVLVLEGGEEVTLGQGDTVIQRGATHAWRNDTDQPCVASVVIVSAQADTDTAAD